MNSAILLTGRPGCGKTTLIRRVVTALPVPAGGFFTQEIRHQGKRQGFEMVTLDGRRGTLAHVSIRGGPNVGKYGVDITTLNEVGVNAVQEAFRAGRLVVIDEIGPMELFSPDFRQVVLEVLASPSALLGTIVQRSIPFTDQIKRRPEVNVLEVRPDNRDALPSQIIAQLEMLTG